MLEWTRRWLVVGVICGALAGGARAQWSDDPALNLAVADLTGEQVQAKVVIAADGSIYISWFDNATGGYDVTLQRLSSDGLELWPHNGVLLADRGFSSTQDYDLDMDTAGNALVAFRDDRFAGIQITATKVDPDGVQVWGANGVQLTSTTDFVAAPKITGTSDGGSIVAWTQNADVRLQKLDASGNTLWAGGVTIAAIGGDNTSASDLETADAGGAIVSMVRGFMSPKHLHAQKFDTDGNPLWGATPLAVFDGGALQTANFPQFVPDGSGGAAFAWYSVSAGLECHAQRILADGTEQFGHNGVVVSTAARDRTAPDVSFNATTDETFVLWREEIGGPNPQYGVFGQKFDLNGARQWTEEGVEVAALSTTELVQVRQVPNGDGAVAAWVRTLAFGNQRVFSARLDGGGALLWSPSATEVSSVASGKSRLFAAAQASGSTVLVWSDGPNDADIYAQNLRSDGMLGVDGAVPALSGIGLGGMVCLLLAAGVGVVRRRSSAV